VFKIGKLWGKLQCGRIESVGGSGDVDGSDGKPTIKAGVATILSISEITVSNKHLIVDKTPHSLNFTLQFQCK